MEFTLYSESENKITVDFSYNDDRGTTLMSSLSPEVFIPEIIVLTLFLYAHHIRSTVGFWPPPQWEGI